MKKLSLIALAAAMSGCVSTARFQAQEAKALAQKERAETLDAQLKKTTADLDASKKLAEDLEHKAKADADQITLLEKSNADLKDSLSANKTQLGQKVSALVAERDAIAKDRDAQAQDRAKLSEQLVGTQAQNADLNKKLDTALAEKKALEDAKAAEVAALKQSMLDTTSVLKKEIAAGQVQITQLKGKLTVNMVDQILFESGKADVRGEGKKVLDKVGEALNKIEGKDIRIEGHTDNKPLTAALQEKFPSNWELSTARATAVARYLIDHAGVDPKRLVAAGYGEFKPKASNDTAEGRAANRRIEIVLVPKE